MKHLSPAEFAAMQREATDYFTVHDFKEWLESHADEISQQSELVQQDLADIATMLSSARAKQ